MSQSSFVSGGSFRYWTPVPSPIDVFSQLQIFMSCYGWTSAYSEDVRGRLAIAPYLCCKYVGARLRGWLAVHGQIETRAGDVDRHVQGSLGEFIVYSLLTDLTTPMRGLLSGLCRLSANRAVYAILMIVRC